MLMLTVFCGEVHTTQNQFAEINIINRKEDMCITLHIRHGIEIVVFVISTTT